MIWIISLFWGMVCLIISLLKTGQYTPEEKKRWWEDNHTDRVDEHIIVIKDQEFIESVRNGTLDLRPYVIDTCTNQSAQSGIILIPMELFYYTIT